MLTQVKDIGLALALVCLALYGVMAFTADGKEKTFVQALRQNNNKQTWAALGMAVLGCALPALGWRLVLAATGVPLGTFVLGQRDSFALAAEGLRGENAVVAGAFERFLINFRSMPVVYNGYGTPLAAALLLAGSGLVLGLWLWRTQKQRGAALALWGMPLFFAAYLFLIFYSYVTMMNETDALINASYQRFLSGFMIGWCMLVLGAVLFYGEGFVKKAEALLPAAALAGVLALILNTAAQHDVLNGQLTRPQAGRDALDAVSGQMLTALQPGDDIWLVVQDGDLLYPYIFHYELIPVRVSLTLPHVLRPAEGETAQQAAQAFAARARAAGVDYVLVYILDEAFVQQYGGLFSDGLASVQQNDTPSLYRVAAEEGEPVFSLAVATIWPPEK